MKNKNNISVLIVVIFFLAGSFLINNSDKNLSPNIKPEDIKYVKIAGQVVKVELALTREELARGLSGRSELKENEGMLFVFPQADKYLFWMKDMNFPIDIVWLAPSEGGDATEAKVIYIKKDARPEFYPETYGPDVSMENAKYVLEIVAGFSEKNNLKVGDRVGFTY